MYQLFLYEMHCKKSVKFNTSCVDTKVTRRIRGPCTQIVFHGTRFFRVTSESNTYFLQCVLI